MPGETSSVIRERQRNSNTCCLACGCSGFCAILVPQQQVPSSTLPHLPAAAGTFASRKQERYLRAALLCPCWGWQVMGPVAVLIQPRSGSWNISLADDCWSTIETLSVSLGTVEMIVEGLVMVAIFPSNMLNWWFPHCCSRWCFCLMFSTKVSNASVPLAEGRANWRNLCAYFACLVYNDKNYLSFSLSASSTSMVHSVFNI